MPWMRFWWNCGRRWRKWPWNQETGEVEITGESVSLVPVEAQRSLWTDGARIDKQWCERQTASAGYGLKNVTVEFGKQEFADQDSEVSIRNRGAWMGHVPEVARRKPMAQPMN